MRRFLTICCAALMGVGLVLHHSPDARAQQQPAPGAAANRQIDIKIRLVYYLAAFVKPAANSPAPAAKNAPIRIVVIGSKLARDRVLNQPALNQPTPDRAPLRNLNDGNVKVHWDGYPTLDKLPDELTPNVIYFLRDDPGIENQLLNLPARCRAPAEVLIITEQDDKFRKEAAVNLYEDKAANRIRIQLRKSSLEDRGLKADPQLLSLQGVLVY